MVRIDPDKQLSPPWLIVLVENAIKVCIKRAERGEPIQIIASVALLDVLR